MNKTEKAARELIREKYFVNGDGKIRQSHPLREQDLIVLMINFVNSQPPNLDQKCNDKWEPLKKDENGEYYSDTEHGRYFYEPEQLKTYRQRIEELDNKCSDLTTMNVNLIELNDKKDRDIEQLTKERDELKVLAENELELKIQYSRKLQAEKSKVKERDVAISKLKRFVSEHEFYTITKELTTKEQ